MAAIESMGWLDIGVVGTCALDLRREGSGMLGRISRHLEGRIDLGQRGVAISVA
jgi:hypothetical protein